MFLHLCLQNNLPDFTLKATRVPKSPPHGQHYHELQASHHEPAAASITQVSSLGFQKYPHTPHLWMQSLHTTIQNLRWPQTGSDNFKFKKRWLKGKHQTQGLVALGASRTQCSQQHLAPNHKSPWIYETPCPSWLSSSTRTPDGATQISKFCCSTTSGENVNLMDFSDSNQSCFHKRLKSWDVSGPLGMLQRNSLAQLSQKMLMLEKCVFLPA